MQTYNVTERKEVYDPFIHRYWDYKTQLAAGAYNLQNAMYNCMINYIESKYECNGKYSIELLNWLKEQVYMSLTYRRKKSLYTAQDEKYAEHIEWLTYFIAYIMCKMEMEHTNNELYCNVLVPMDANSKSLSISFFKRYLGAVASYYRDKYLTQAAREVSLILIVGGRGKINQ